MDKYRVVYTERAWQPRRGMMRQQPLEECQIVECDLPNGEHLYVELARELGGPPRVIIARVSHKSEGSRRQRFRKTTRFLGVDELELIAGE